MPLSGGQGRAAVVLVVIALCLGAISPLDLAARQADTPERLKRISADVFGSGERLKESVADLQAMLAADPGIAEAHFLLGIAYRRLATPDLVGEARAELRQALELDPRHVPARYFLAQMYLDLGRFDQAREELNEGLKQTPGQPQFLALLAETERRSGNAARALALGTEALKVDESFHQARYYRALALFDLGKTAEAIRELERVAASAPPVIDVHLALGTAYAETGRLDDAVKVLGEAAAMEPSRRDVKIQLARAYRLKGLLAKANQELKAAGEDEDALLNSTSAADQQLAFDLWRERGLLALQQGRVAAAVAALQKALGLQPQDGPANRAIAAAYLRQGAYARAAEHAARAEKRGAPLPADTRKLLDQKLKGGASK